MKILGCPPFLKYITPNYSPMMWGKIWNVHKNIRTLHKDHKKQKWNGDLVILAEKWWIFTFLTPKSTPEPPKITFSKNPKKRFLLVPRRVLIPNFKSLCRKLRPGARRTDTQTDTQKVKEGRILFHFTGTNQRKEWISRKRWFNNKGAAWNVLSLNSSKATWTWKTYLYASLYTGKYHKSPFNKSNVHR